MANDNQNNHNEADLGVVLDVARTAPPASPGTDGAVLVQIGDIIADYHHASSGYEVDLSALFDSIAGHELAGDLPDAGGSQAAGGASDEVDLSVLFEAEAGGHAEAAQTDTGLSNSTHGDDGFTTFTAVAAYPGVVSGLYGDDSNHQPGPAAG